jgi:hypothetical protein
VGESKKQTGNQNAGDKAKDAAGSAGDAAKDAGKTLETFRHFSVAALVGWLPLLSSSLFLFMDDMLLSADLHCR